MTEPVAAEPDWTVTEPGLVEDMPADAYHRDPVPGGSLSSTGARRLLPPGCPARYRYEVDNPPDTTDTLDLGKAAHTMVLSAGEAIDVLDYPDYKTRKAQDEKAASRAAGRIPLLPKQLQQVQDMAKALREHPTAAALLDPATGRPEVSAFAPTTVVVEGGNGEPVGVPVWLRARFDFLPALGDGSGRFLIPDYKTCESADPEKLQRSFADWWYPQQADFYETVLRLLGYASDPRVLFICQEKKPPYLVTVVDPDVIARRAAVQRNREALALYARCRLTERWPGYAEDVVPLPLPAYIENQYV